MHSITLSVPDAIPETICWEPVSFEGFTMFTRVSQKTT